MVQIAMIISRGTPYFCSMRENRSAYCANSFLARLMRAGMTRVRAYVSKLTE